MKNRFSSLLFSCLIAVALVSVAEVAPAQTTPGVYPLFTGATLTLGTTNQYIVSTNVVGGTNLFGSPGSSTNFTINVSQFDYVGLTITGAGRGTTTNAYFLYKSFDNGTTYETVASFRYLQSYTSGAVTTTNASLDVHGVTHLALFIGTVGDDNVTNAAIKFNLKSPLVYVAAPIGGGRSPGTPISVPNSFTNSP